VIFLDGGTAANKQTTAIDQRKIYERYYSLIQRYYRKKTQKLQAQQVKTR